MPPHEFCVPSKLEDLPVGRQGLSVAEIELDEALQDFDGIVDSLCERSTNIVEHENFSVLVNLVRLHSQLSDAVKSRLLDVCITHRPSSWVLISGMACTPILVDSLTNRNGGGAEQSQELVTVRNCIRVHALLLKFLVSFCEKANAEGAQEQKAPARSAKGGKGAKGTMGAGKKGTKVTEVFAWDTLRPKVMQTLRNVLAGGIMRAWAPARPEEAFVSLFLSMAWVGLGSPAAVKDKDTRASCIDVVLRCAAPAVGQATSAVTGLQDLLHQHEHAAVPIAELVAAAAKAQDAAFVAEMMVEVGRVPFHELARDNAAARNLATFVSEVSEQAPGVILGHMSVLNPHLQQGEAYVMRNAVLHAIGQALVELARITREERSDTVVKARESLLAIMRERVHDVNAFTRSKVLQVWATLCEQDAVPKKVQPAVVVLATERLQDKSAQVRKSAIQLLRALVQKNPYSHTLPLSLFKAKLEEAAARLAAKEEAIGAAARIQEDDEEEGEEDAKPGESKGKDAGEQEVKEEKEEEAEDAGEAAEGREEESQAAAEKAEERQEAADKAEDRELDELRSRVNFYQAAVQFVSTLHRAVSTIETLLRSSTTSDVVEAMHFLVAAFPFRMEVAEQSVRRMLVLIWSKEQTVKDAVADAYRAIFLAPLQHAHSAEALDATARQLSALCRGASVGEVASLEQVLSQMASAGSLPPALLSRVWDLMVAPDPDPHAAVLLSLSAANAEAPLAAKLRALLHDQDRLGRLLQSPLLARCLCAISARLASRLTLHDKALACQMLVRVAMAEAGGDGRWLPACEEAVNAMAKLHPAPHQGYGSVLRGMALQVFGREGAACEGWRLARLLHVIGHVAVKQLALVEGVAAQQARERDKEAEAGAGKEAKGEAAEEEGIEASVGAVDAAVQDTRAEVARELAEQDLLSGQSLVGIFGPMVRDICANADGRYKEEQVRAAAVLAMCKLMCVSSDYCEQNLQLLFSIMVAAPEPVVRSNIVVALGDMAFRWTNLTEPWMAHIYSLLRDHSTEVRHNTLTVLTHLVLNDMIKVRGQVSEMALCLEDADERIQDMARLFFSEFKLKQQGMLLYNLLPDMVGRLSAAQLDEGKFRRIIRVVFGLVDKVKQTDALVDKLCQRFRATDDSRQWRDIAFCLAQLAFSERGVRKLLEEANFKAFAGKLGDEDIAASFAAIVAKAKKLAARADKADAKDGRGVGDELEARLREATDGCEPVAVPPDSEEAGGADRAERRPSEAPGTTKKGAAKAKGKAKAPAAKGAAKGRGGKRRVVQSSSEGEEEEEEEDASDLEPLPMEEEEEDEKENTKANAKKTSKAAAKPAAPAARSSGRATRSARS